LLKLFANREILSWGLYDWANSAFATTVIAGFFPVFFKQYWAASQTEVESTFYLGLVNALASLVIVIFAPLLGALADQLSRRKKMLMNFAILGILMTAGLSLLGEGAWLMALMLYFFALIGFSGSNIFYDSLILNVASLKQVDRVSSIGFALGYLGGGLLFAFNVLMVTWPEWFGLADASAAVKWSFVSVGLWWAAFSVPLLLFVKEEQGAQKLSLELVRMSYQNVVSTIKKIRQLKMTFIFLVAYWLYIDGVDTIIRMAVDFGLAVGLESNGLLAALLLTQFVGFPAALVFGWIGHVKGPKFGIFVALLVYCLIVLWAMQLSSQWEFYVLAFAVGLVQGGIQSLSRSLYARLVPVSQKTEFFGFYNMLGKFAAVIGPLLVGVTGIITGQPHVGIFMVLLLFVTGGYLLSRVDIQAGEQQARIYQA
jgi:MFS transporter, UMF1 family